MTTELAPEMFVHAGQSRRPLEVIALDFSSERDRIVGSLLVSIDLRAHELVCRPPTEDYESEEDAPEPDEAEDIPHEPEDEPRREEGNEDRRCYGMSLGPTDDVVDMRFHVTETRSG